MLANCVAWCLLAAWLIVKFCLTVREKQPQKNNSKLDTEYLRGLNSGSQCTASVTKVPRFRPTVDVFIITVPDEADGMSEVRVLQRR